MASSDIDIDEVMSVSTELDIVPKLPKPIRKRAQSVDSRREIKKVKFDLNIKEENFEEDDEPQDESEDDEEEADTTKPCKKKGPQPKFYIDDVIECLERVINDSTDDYKSTLAELKNKCHLMHFMRRRDAITKRRQLKSYVHIYRCDKTLGFYNNSYKNPKELKVANMIIKPMLTICLGYKDDSNKARDVIKDIKTFTDDQYLCTYHDTPKKFKNVVSYKMLEKYCEKVMRYCKRHNFEVVHNNYSQFNNVE